VRDHLLATPEFQNHSLRFLENHDEPRAAATFQPPERHMAAAVITFFVPGLRFFYEGQLEGRRARASMHLGRRVQEQPDPQIAAFYERLLGVLRRREVHDGAWSELAARPAWDGNPTWDNFVAGFWDGGAARLLTIVNYGGTQAQCYLPLEGQGLEGRKVVLTDLLGDARFERDGTALERGGLYLDMPAWGRHVFELRVA
jgi:hypothetical protein